MLRKDGGPGRIKIGLWAKTQSRKRYSEGLWTDKSNRDQDMGVHLRAI